MISERYLWNCVPVKHLDNSLYHP